MNKKKYSKKVIWQVFIIVSLIALVSAILLGILFSYIFKSSTPTMITPIVNNHNVLINLI